MVDVLAVGFIVGGAALYLTRRALINRKSEVDADTNSACGCAGAGKAGCKH